MRLCMGILFLILVILQEPDETLGYYETSRGITRLTESNFRDQVLNSKYVWFIQFYAEWCPHCEKALPEMKKLGLKQKGFRVGAVDGPLNKKLRKQYHIKGYPTFITFAKNKKLSPNVYAGPLKVAEIIRFMNAEYNLKN